MSKPLYTGQPLQSNEFLLKINGQTGFLTKLTKKGELPKAFDEWTQYYMGTYGQPSTLSPKLPVYVHTEIPKSGWKLIRWRIGKSQEWTTMMHPDGFTVEIYLSDFLQHLQRNTLINGVIQGVFTWEDHKLKQH